MMAGDGDPTASVAGGSSAVTLDSTSQAGIRVVASAESEPTAACFDVRAVARSHGDRLRLKGRSGPRPVSAPARLVLEGQDGGRLVAFRFGAGVAVGLGPAEEQRLLAEVQKIVESPHDWPGHEEAVTRVGGSSIAST